MRKEKRTRCAGPVLRVGIPPQKMLCDMAEALRAHLNSAADHRRIVGKVCTRLRKQAGESGTELRLTKAVLGVSFSRPVVSTTRQRRHIERRSQTPTSLYRDRSSSPWVSTASKQDTGSTFAGACLLKRDHSTKPVSRSRETGWARVAMPQARIHRRKVNLEIASEARQRTGFSTPCTDRRSATDGRVS